MTIKPADDLDTLPLPELELLHPVKLATGETLEKVTIHTLRRKDLTAAQRHGKDETLMEELLLAKMTGLTVEDLGELHIADARRVAERFQAMLGEGKDAG